MISEVSSATSAAQQYQDHDSVLVRSEVDVARAEAQSVASNFSQRFDDLRALAQIQSTEADSLVRDKERELADSMAKQRNCDWK